MRSALWRVEDTLKPLSSRAKIRSYTDFLPDKLSISGKAETLRLYWKVREERKQVIRESMSGCSRISASAGPGCGQPTKCYRLGGEECGRWRKRWRSVPRRLCKANANCKPRPHARTAMWGEADNVAQEAGGNPSGRNIRNCWPSLSRSSIRPPAAIP